MSGERTKAILRAGILPNSALAEASRWQVDLPEVEPTNDLREVLDTIREAVEGPDTVNVRLTDLDAVHHYLENKTRGRLYFADGESTTFVEVDYAKDRMGNYIIPWTDSDDIIVLMMERTTYLKPRNEEGVHFVDAHELHYGENKTFILAIPDKVSK